MRVLINDHATKLGAKRLDRQLRRMRGREKENSVAAGNYEQIYRCEIRGGQE